MPCFEIRAGHRESTERQERLADLFVNEATKCAVCGWHEPSLLSLAIAQLVVVVNDAGRRRLAVDGEEAGRV
jgi:hypothetical protein